MSCDYCGKVSGDLSKTVPSCSTENVKMICNLCCSIITEKKHFFMFTLAEKRLKKWIDRTRKK